MDFEREIPFREMERDAVERRLAALDERLNKLITKRRSLETAGNIDLPPALRFPLGSLAAELALKVWLQVQEEVVDQEIMVVSDTMKANREISDKLSQRLRQLHLNQDRSRNDLANLKCGLNYLPIAATPESCGLLPLAPMDTIGDRDFTFRLSRHRLAVEGYSIFGSRLV